MKRFKRFLKKYWKIIMVIARVKKAGIKDYKTLDFLANFLWDYNDDFLQEISEKRLAQLCIAILKKD